MPSSLHVSLPDELRAFVDVQTDGSGEFSTPSEYVRALIREDMTKRRERDYVLGELNKSLEDIKNGRLVTPEDLDASVELLFKELEQEDKDA